MENERKGTLIILACHGVYDPTGDVLYAEHPADRPVFEAQLGYAFNHLRWRAESDPLLVVSGGRTKIQRDCSEGRSYVEMARRARLRVPEGIVVEQHALTSIENVLFSLYVFCQVRGHFPAFVETVSWEFKRERFVETLRALNRWDRLGPSWPDLRFFPVGDLWGEARAQALTRERNYVAALQQGIDAYYREPQTIEVVARRDVYLSRELTRKAYAGFPLPF